VRRGTDGLVAERTGHPVNRSFRSGLAHFSVAAMVGVSTGAAFASGGAERAFYILVATGVGLSGLMLNGYTARRSS
jgi:hypothetical protein